MSASSHLGQGRSAEIRPQNLADGRRDTAWCEGAAGDGVGEWVELHFDRETKLAAVTIVNGRDRGGASDRWRESGRVRGAVLEVDGGRYRIEIADTRSPQRFTFARPPAATYLRLAVESVYPGTRHADTCLSEVTVEHAM